VNTACGAEAAGRRPGPVAGSYSSALASGTLLLNPPATSTLAVGQQRRRVRIACGGEAAGRRPDPGGRIVQFRAREWDAAVKSPATSTLPLGSNVAV